MYQSIKDPSLLVTLDELRNLYPDILIGGDLRNDSLRLFGIPFRNLDPAVLRDEKMEALDASFADRVRGSITTSQGFMMQFDTSDSLKMQGAIQLMEATGATEGYLTQANDVTEYHVPLATMKAVLVEMLGAYAACHARKQELRALINNAATETGLNEIVISWPV